EALRKHRVPAIGFVIERKLQVRGERDARAQVLESWLDAGMELANHTYAHKAFSDVTLAEYEDEMVRGAVVALALMAARGRTMRYFRHPSLDTGRSREESAAFEEFLASRGYRVAPVTLENADYEFNDALNDARTRQDGKLAERVEAEYVAHTDSSFRYSEQ